MDTPTLTLVATCGGLVVATFGAIIGNRLGNRNAFANEMKVSNDVLRADSEYQRHRAERAEHEAGVQRRRAEDCEAARLTPLHTSGD